MRMITAAEVFSRLPGPARARLARALPEGALERLLDALCPRAGGAEARRPYFAASAWEHARRRLVWLLVLMVSAALTGAIITRYEAAISAVPLLVAFLPMLMDTGGNCGSQSAALVIRGLALGEILPQDALRVARRELAVAAIVGAALAGACGLWVLLQYHSWPLALTVALSLLVYFKFRPAMLREKAKAA